ncbi:MAG: hypothetical protein OHK006_13930 [Thermodesulfovibrionales bacterium]
MIMPQTEIMGVLCLYDPADLVCVMTIPPYQGKRQRFYRVSELSADAIRQELQDANTAGSNIYLSVYPFIRPERNEAAVVSEVNRLFFDFDEAPAYLRFIADYQPGIVIETSPGKHQCFLILSEPIPKLQAKSIARALAHEYGADHTFDSARVFRFPGFDNCKYPGRPLSKIIETSAITYSAYNLPHATEGIADKQPSPDHDPAGDPSARRTTGRFVPNELHNYQYFLERVPSKASGEPNYSQADFRYSVYLFSFFDLETIRVMLLRESPGLSRRKKGGLENYLNKTLTRARDYQQTHYREYSRR